MVCQEHRETSIRQRRCELSFVAVVGYIRKEVKAATSWCECRTATESSFREADSTLAR